MKRTTAWMLPALTVAATTTLIVWMRLEVSAPKLGDPYTLFNQVAWLGSLACLAGAAWILGQAREPEHVRGWRPTADLGLALLAIVMLVTGPSAPYLSFLTGRVKDLTWVGAIYASSALAFLLAMPTVIAAIRSKARPPILAMSVSIPSAFVAFASSWILLFFE